LNPRVIQIPAVVPAGSKHAPQPPARRREPVLAGRFGITLSDSSG
jgi:hypothetical protein